MADLVASITANGLRNPILLDEDGVLVDGRNRLHACQVAGVQPTFALFEGDPVAAILDQNVHRRHMNAGARAMAAVVAELEHGWQPNAHGGASLATKLGQVAVKAGASAAGVSQALTVQRYAPWRVDEVLANGSLEAAYKEAAQYKRKSEPSKAKLSAACKQYPELAQALDEGRLTAGEVVSRAAQLEAAAEADDLAKQVALLQEDVASQPLLELPAKPDMAELPGAVDELAQTLVAGEIEEGNRKAALQAQLKLSRKLLDAEMELAHWAKQPPALSYLAKEHVDSVRRLCRGIVAHAYTIVQQHNDEYDKLNQADGPFLKVVS